MYRYIEIGPSYRFTKAAYVSDRGGQFASIILRDTGNLLIGCSLGTGWSEGYRELSREALMTRTLTLVGLQGEDDLVESLVAIEPLWTNAPAFSLLDVVLREHPWFAAVAIHEECLDTDIVEGLCDSVLVDALPAATYEHLTWLS